MKKINWIRFRWLYTLISGLLIAMSIYSLVSWRLNLGIEFTGGTIAEYAFNEKISTEEFIEKLTEKGIEVGSIQSIDENSYLFRMGHISEDKRSKLTNTLSEVAEQEVTEVQFETVGPTIGPELVRKTLYAIGISAAAILIWVAIQFASVKFGISAIIAMFHDSFILVGIFSLLGHYYGAEADFLFVTALLTTLSFSVHDTIVVYDRIREIRKKHGGEIVEIANRAVSETMRRSINNSVTIALMLVSLLIFGGSSIFWFAAALLVGTVLGTYSSPFVAVPVLVSWEQFGAKIKLPKKVKKK